MEAVFDARSFAALRSDLSSRLGATISGLALLDADSKVSALDEGMAEALGEPQHDALGRPLPWLFTKLGLPKKTDPSDLMNRPVGLPNGQQVAMGLTAEGLALSVIGEPTVAILHTEPEVQETPLTVEVMPKPARSAPLPAVGLEDFALALGACRDTEDLALVVESWLPELIPGSRGTLSSHDGARAVVLASWPAGFAPKPTQYATDRCMALRLGHTFPDVGVRIPLRCRHGIDGPCVPVTWSGEVFGVISAESADVARLEKVARILAPYAYRLDE